MAEFEIFKKVPVSERKVLLQALVDRKLVILVKGSKDEIYQMTTEFQLDEKNLVLSCQKDPRPPQKNDEVFVNLEHAEERYFFRGFLRPDSIDGFVLTIDDAIYQLQRRKTARVDFPEGYVALFHMNLVNGQKSSIETALLDYSSGGMRLKILKSVLAVKIGDVYRGSLYLGKRAPFELSCVVRHIKDSADGQYFEIGAQYYPLDRVLESKLMTIFMDIQRELFMKQNKKMI